jgi:hypothetical protein
MPGCGPGPTGCHGPGAKDMLLPEMQVLARVSRLSLGSVPVVQASTAQGEQCQFYRHAISACASRLHREQRALPCVPSRTSSAWDGAQSSRGQRRGRLPLASNFPHPQASTIPLQSDHPSHGRASICKGWHHRSHQEQAAGPPHVCEQRFRAHLWFQRWSFSSKARGAQRRNKSQSQPLHYGGSEVGEAL